MIAMLNSLAETERAAISNIDLHIQVRKQDACVTGRSSDGSRATMSQTLPNARQYLLSQLQIEARRSYSDPGHAQKMTRNRTCLLARIDEVTQDIIVNTQYQRPRSPVMERPVKHKERVMARRKHSEPQRTLYRKLKKACADDYRDLKQIRTAEEAAEKAVQGERRLLQQRMHTLNRQIQQHNVQYEVPVDDNIASLSHLLSGNTDKVEFSRKSSRLQRRSSAGKLTLLRNRERRYSDVRILPCEVQEIKENWFVKCAKVVQSYRKMVEPVST
jgi:hypothetical protein